MKEYSRKKLLFTIGILFLAVGILSFTMLNHVAEGLDKKDKEKNQKIANEIKSILSDDTVVFINRHGQSVDNADKLLPEDVILIKAGKKEYVIVNKEEDKNNEYAKRKEEEGYKLLTTTEPFGYLRFLFIPFLLVIIGLFFMSAASEDVTYGVK